MVKKSQSELDGFLTIASHKIDCFDLFESRYNTLLIAKLFLKFFTMLRYHLSLHRVHWRKIVTLAMNNAKFNNYFL